MAITDAAQEMIELRHRLTTSARQHESEPINAGKPWTDNDINHLKTMIDSGYATYDIAAAMGRTASAIASKVMTLPYRFSDSLWRNCDQQRARDTQAMYDHTQALLGAPRSVVLGDCHAGTGWPHVSEEQRRLERYLQDKIDLCLNLSACPPMSASGIEGVMLKSREATNLHKFKLDPQPQLRNQGTKMTYDRLMVIATGKANLAAHRQALTDSAARAATDVGEYVKAVLPAVLQQGKAPQAPVAVAFILDRTRVYEDHIRNLEHAFGPTVEHCDAVEFLLRDPAVINAGVKGTLKLCRND